LSVVILSWWSMWWLPSSWWCCRCISLWLEVVVRGCRDWEWLWATKELSCFQFFFTFGLSNLGDHWIAQFGIYIFFNCDYWIVKSSIW